MVQMEVKPQLDIKIEVLGIIAGIVIYLTQITILYLTIKILHNGKTLKKGENLHHRTRRHTPLVRNLFANIKKMLHGKQKHL